MKNDVIIHYDALIDEGNDPFRDPKPLKEYMDRWDGTLFLACLSLNKNKTVLEIGVGTGRLAERVAPLCKEFTGIDISGKTIERAKENLAGLSNITLISDEFYRHVFCKQFDIIYSSLTFMHFKDKQKAIEIVFSILKPGGVFVLSIDKNTDNRIRCGERVIEIFPDDLQSTKEYIKNAGFVIKDVVETDAAYIISAEK